MDRATFKQRLESAGKAAVEFARKRVWNPLSDNVVFMIRPNLLDTSDHLQPAEVENLLVRKAELHKIWPAVAVAERLWIDGKVPIWINCTVFKARKHDTIVQLLTSRRFRGDEALYHQQGAWPPFHVTLFIPPYMDLNADTKQQKFDVNWQHKKLRLAWKMWQAKRHHLNSL